MKLSTTFLATIFSLAAFAVAGPTGEYSEIQGAPIDARAALKGCGGDREDSDQCGGKFLQKRNSFHNCKTLSKGKCCAKDRDGSGGIDVNKGGGEECGYCFSGKCKG